MANPFTYPAWDLVTLQPRDPLPYTDVTFGQQLNQPGPFAGNVAIADEGVRQLAWNDATLTGRTLVAVDLLGTLVWGGVIWTRRYDDEKHQVAIGAAELGSYFRSRLQRFDYSNTWVAGADPMVIAKRIVQDADTLAPIAGGVTLTLNPAGGSGQTITPSYPGTQLQTIDQIVATLSQMGYSLGFDFSFDVQYLSGTKTPGVTLNFWYPRQGRTADRSQIVVAYRDTLRFTYDEDSVQQALEVYEAGSGSGGVQPDVASTAVPGYPLLQTAISHPEVSDQGVLSNLSLGDLAARCYPSVTPTVALPIPVPDAAGRIDAGRLSFGGFGLGDDAELRISPVADGAAPEKRLNQSPRFPGGMVFAWRITNWTARIPNQGVPSLLFDLGVPPLATLPPPPPPL